jgi:hypothetical protein
VAKPIAVLTKKPSATSHHAAPTEVFTLGQSRDRPLEANSLVGATINRRFKLLV